MEIRIRTGENNLSCEISGKPEAALIKLYALDDKETPWMGVEALLNAYNLLLPLTKNSPPPPSSVALPGMPARSTQGFIGQLGQPDLGEEPAKRPAPAYAPNPEDLKDLEKQLVMLTKNPPPDKNGNAQDVLPESSVRGLIGSFLNRFRDPMVMYPVVQKHVPQMTRSRFEIQINSLKKEAKMINRLATEDDDE